MNAVGWEVGQAVRAVGGQENRSALTELFNQRINEAVGIESGQRGTLSAKQAEDALVQLDQIGDRVRDEVREALGR